MTIMRTLFALLMLTTPVAAMDREQLIAGLQSFSDGADAQRLEDKIAE